MAFDDLPPSGKLINPRADTYGTSALMMSRAATITTRHELDIPYGEDWWQKLDVWLPPGGQHRDLPVFVNIHGGGFAAGHKEWMGFGAPPIVALPAIYVSLNYRLGPVHRFPAPLEDCLAGLAWVHRNVHRYGGSPDRIMVGGHSAGGALCTWLALRRDRYAAHKLPDKVVKASFPVSGLFSADKPGANGGREIINFAQSIVGPAEVHDATAMNFVAGNTTPFFITWAENDNPDCKAQAGGFVDALSKEKGRVEHHYFPGHDHYTIHLDQANPRNLWVQTLKNWLAGDPATAPVAKE